MARKPENKNMADSSPADTSDPNVSKGYDPTDNGSGDTTDVDGDGIPDGTPAELEHYAGVVVKEVEDLVGGIQLPTLPAIPDIFGVSNTAPVANVAPVTPAVPAAARIHKWKRM